MALKRVTSLVVWRGIVLIGIWPSRISKWRSQTSTVTVVPAWPLPTPSFWAHIYTAVLGPVTSHLALCAAATGDLDESVALFEEGDQVLAGFGCHGLFPLFRLAYAEVLRRRGSDHDRRLAMQLLDQVRQGATAVGAPNLIRQADELAAVIISASR